MVGRQVLVLLIGVRVPISEQKTKRNLIFPKHTKEGPLLPAFGGKYFIHNTLKTYDYWLIINIGVCLNVTKKMGG